ncbi:MAG: DUF2812 domain-containing protein [Clostridia bacterium]|nr:DUF2812 domain-containing protein [Clostridia bacterium]
MKTKILLKNALYQNPIDDERVLNKYAKKGWVLKKSNSFYSKLEKTDGENKKYSVQYISNLKRIGNKLSEQDELFIELCEADDWKFVSKAGNFLYFETVESNEKKIRTDDEVYKKSVFQLLLIQEITWFLVLLLAGFFVFFVSYKTGDLFVNRFHLPVAVMGIFALVSSLPALFLTIVEKMFFGFPDEKIERVKVKLKKFESFSVMFSLFVSLISYAFNKLGYDVLFLYIVLIIITAFYILLKKSVKNKTFFIVMGVLAVIITFCIKLVPTDAIQKDYVQDGLSCKTEQECFEIANDIYKKHSVSEVGLEKPGFIDDKVHNYKGESFIVSSVVSARYMYLFEDEITNERFCIIAFSTLNDLLRDYYLKYYWCDRFDTTFESLKELLEADGYVRENEKMYFLAKDGVIIFIANSAPEAENEAAKE